MAMRFPKEPKPVPGQPGHDTTPSDLQKRWRFESNAVEVYPFYSAGKSAGVAACFSNFVWQTPYEFEVPMEFCAVEFAEHERRVQCGFSEKAIMLCKAASMGDKASFFKIAKSSDPKSCKALGRAVNNFRQEVWDKIVCSVAYQVVFQKFQKTAKLREHLLATGSTLLAEATKNDSHWGIGIDKGMPDAGVPAKWKGTNILGWALTEARESLRGDAVKVAAEPESIAANGSFTFSLHSEEDLDEALRALRCHGMRMLEGGCELGGRFRSESTRQEVAAGEPPRKVKRLE
jgi:ribA/ribD-fused uncharacterized protein